MAAQSERTRNLTLRAIRLSLNLSQDEFAAALREAGRRSGEPNGATKRLVQRWEAGVTVSARPVYRRALEAVTGRPYPSLGFGTDERVLAAARPAAPREGEPAPRSGLVDLASFLDDPTDPSYPSYPRDGAAVGSDFVARLRARTDRLRRLDDTLGGMDTFPLYISELRETLLVLRRGRYSETTGVQLAGILAEQAQQAGWTAIDMGAGENAARLFEFSLHAARSINDSSVAGNALALLAYQQTLTGRAGAETAAAAYREAGDRAPAGVRTLLAQRLAWAYAVSGESVPAQRALALAQTHLGATHTQPVPDWAAWADEREQRIIEGRCWTELGEAEKAVAVLEPTLASYGGGRARNKSLFLTWLAVAYLRTGEVEASASTIEQASQMASDIASPRLTRRIDSIVRMLRPHSSVPRVATMLDRRLDAAHSSAALILPDEMGR